jgi:potassium channel subfamily K
MEKPTHSNPQARRPNYLFVHFRRRWNLPAIKSSLADAVPTLPLICALLAPASTLYDIPALTQRWYTQNGSPAADSPASIALSATGLAFNAVANTLLVLRFSATGHRWRKTTVIASTLAWVIKSILAIINLALYGASQRNGE